MTKEELRRQFYLEYGREKLNLENTREAAALWLMASKQGKKYEKFFCDLEEYVKERASVEWGEGTRVIFDYNNLTVNIVSDKRKAFCEIIDESQKNVINLSAEKVKRAYRKNPNGAA